MSKLTAGADALVWLAVLAETVVLGWLVVRHADGGWLFEVVWCVVLLVVSVIDVELMMP